MSDALSEAAPSQDVSAAHEPTEPKFDSPPSPKPSFPRPMTAREATGLRALLVVAALMLGVGLVGPCLSVVPKFSGYDSWVKLLDPSLTEVSEYSVVTGILALYREGSVGIALLLAGFSVAFPTLKLATMGGAVEALRRRQGPGWLMKLTHHTGKFSMLDVWVVALLVLAIKGLPGDAEVQLGWGIYLFAGSVVLTIVVGAIMHHIEGRRG